MMWFSLFVAAVSVTAAAVWEFIRYRRVVASVTDEEVAADPLVIRAADAIRALGTAAPASAAWSLQYIEELARKRLVRERWVATTSRISRCFSRSWSRLFRWRQSRCYVRDSQDFVQDLLVHGQAYPIGTSLDMAAQTYFLAYETLRALQQFRRQQADCQLALQQDLQLQTHQLAVLSRAVGLVGVGLGLTTLDDPLPADSTGREPPAYPVFRFNTPLVVATRDKPRKVRKSPKS